MLHLPFRPPCPPPKAVTTLSVKVIPTAPCLSNDACSAYIVLFLLGSGPTSGHRMLATVRGKTMRFFDCHVWV